MAVLALALSLVLLTVNYGCLQSFRESPSDYTSCTIQSNDEQDIHAAFFYEMGEDNKERVFLNVNLGEEMMVVEFPLNTDGHIEMLMDNILAGRSTEVTKKSESKNAEFAIQFHVYNNFQRETRLSQAL